MSVTPLDRFVMSIAAALRDEGCAKTVARLARVHPRTAARWQAGDTEPDGAHLLRMMGASPGLAARLLALAGLSDDALRADIAALRTRIDTIEERLHAPADRSPAAAPCRAAGHGGRSPRRPPP